MDIYWNLISIYIIILFILFIITVPAKVIYHLKLTGEVISLLRQQGFDDLSQRIETIVSSVGRLQPRGWSKESKEHYNSWKEFRLLNIPKNMGKLYKLQFLYKSIYLLQIVFLIVAIIPFILIFISFMLSVIKK